MKTAELTGTALDWAVAKARPSKYGEVTFDPYTKRVYEMMLAGYDFRPSADWKTGGPIIEREGISTKFLCVVDDPKRWVAYSKPSIKVVKPAGVYGPTALIAAMRCYVASKLGADVEIPEELSC